MSAIPAAPNDVQPENRRAEVDLSGIMNELAQAAAAHPPVPSTAERINVEQAPYREAQGSIPWPPGRAGVIARFPPASSSSPIPEVAITAALGLLAGVCGRAYRTHTGKDLALYII